MSHALLKSFRLIHLYVGVFITPAILFFAFTGALQTFGLHETNRDHPNYTPAHWIVVLGQIHKKQTPIVPVRRPPPASIVASAGGNTPATSPTERAGTPHHAAEASAQPDSSKQASAPAPPAPPTPATPVSPKHNPLPLRIFFLLVAIGLFTSTLTGLYMSYKFIRNKTLITLTLLGGAILPLILLAL